MTVSHEEGEVDAWPLQAAIGPDEQNVELRRFAQASSWNRPELTRILGAGLGELLVVTGQQPAVGGGPVYTLVKVAHAIALAHSLATVPGGVSPLFWCASEDHDLGEAGHADIITRSGILQRLSVDLGPGRSALRYRPAALWFDAMVEHCRLHCGPGPGASWLEASRPAAAEGMGQWLCRLLERLFSVYRLRCIEGHVLRPLWREGISRALTEWPTNSLATLRDRLLESGQADAFGALAGPPLFADRPEGRVALTVPEAVQLLRQDPNVLSPGAALRPVLQQIALPAAIYVAGPGELHYHRFIAPLYKALGATRPRLTPRISVTLLPPWVQRGLAYWGRTPDDTGSQSAPTAHTLRSGLDALSGALRTAELDSAQLPGDFQQRVATGIKRLRRERDRLEQSLVRGEARKQDAPSWGAIASFLRPRSALQERSMSLFQAIWDHGPGIVHPLVDAARTLAPGEHRFLAL